MILKYCGLKNFKRVKNINVESYYLFLKIHFRVICFKKYCKLLCLNIQQIFSCFNDFLELIKLKFKDN